MSRSFNWLRAYAEYTKESESPDSFHLWTGLSVISSAVRRNVVLNQGLYLLYPNMYIVLVGPPGKVAKSTAMRLGRRLLLGLDDIIFGPDSVTREELIRVLAKSGGEGKNSVITIHSSEMSSLIEPSGIHMIQFLTDIYDGDFKWRYSTKGQGKDVIHNPLLNMITCTIPDYIANDLPISIIGSGFSARLILVYEDSPRFANPFPQEPDKNLVVALTEELRHIATLEGEFQFTPEARQLYIDQYKTILDTAPSDYRLQDFHYRKKIHLLKVAMLLSLAERDTLTIEVPDLETAWHLLTALEENMPKAFSAVGKYQYASDLERIVEQVREAKEIPAQEVFRRNRAVGDAETLGKILLTAMRAGLIEQFKKDKELWFRPASP